MITRHLIHYTTLKFKCLYEYLYKYLNGKSKSASLYETGLYQVIFVIKLCYPYENNLSRNQIISTIYIYLILQQLFQKEYGFLFRKQRNYPYCFQRRLILFQVKKESQQSNLLSQMNHSLPFQICFFLIPWFINKRSYNDI